MNETDYNNFFMEKALEEAKKALDAGEFPVGCALVYENNILCTGSRQGTSANGFNETDHAEIVAIRRLEDIEKKSGTKDRNKITLFCTLEPCLMCYGALLINGIRRIVYAYEDAMGGGTRCKLEIMPPLYSAKPVMIVPRILRKRSIELFKKYFSSENKYLRGTVFAEYTLAQDTE